MGGQQDRHCGIGSIESRTGRGGDNAGLEATIGLGEGTVEAPGKQKFQMSAAMEIHIYRTCVKEGAKVRRDNVCEDTKQAAYQEAGGSQASTHQTPKEGLNTGIKRVFPGS